jgi:multidrug efflux pump subunit AcrB
MWLVLTAMRRPITVLVAVVAVFLCALLAISRMQVDIFPNLGAPAIYVAQPYAGMSPAQMESFLTYNYEYQFFYINGIEHVESKSIQGAARMKLVFHPGTDMNQAMSQVVASVNRARANMPPGTVPPFIIRFDAGSVPVAQLVFSSPTRNVGEMQDLAVTRVRPLFASLPGVSAPPPFGASSRAVVVRLDPERMRAYRLSPEDAIGAINRASSVMPAGNVRVGDLMTMATTNASMGGDFRELADAPIRTGSGPAVYLHDIGTVENGTDITAGFAHVDGKRTVYIPVTKRADASTLAVIQEVKDALPAMRALVPPDVEIRMEFDQSRYVVNAITGLVREGLVGALLTGLMVLLFLRDWRSALIVVTTIPVALLSAVIGLWALGQTINIMTLGGLALAVGVLVDEATVSIENMHTEMARGRPRALAVAEAARNTAVPRLLAMLAILAVFVPSFFMVGVGQQLFVPLSLAVGFSMVSSYVLSSTLVPVLCTWLMRTAAVHAEQPVTLFDRVRGRYIGVLRRVVARRWPLIIGYSLSTGLLLFFLWPRLGTEIFPEVDTGQLQIRLRAPTGTRIERTEQATLKALDVITREVGADNVLISTDYVGAMPSANPNNTIYLWTSGPHEAVLRVAVKPTAPVRGDALKERLRDRLREALPQVAFSFEPGDIVGQVMSFGAPTPIEVDVQGPSLTADRDFAERVRGQLAGVSSLRDLQYGQPLDYPTLDVQVNRDRAGQLGLTTTNVARSLVAATSSSRFIEPNFWRDPASGNSYQIQIQIPENQMTSAEDVLGLPVVGESADTLAFPMLRDVATVQPGHTDAEVDRYNMQRMISLTANVHGKTLGDVARDVRMALGRAGAPPRGTTVEVRGQIAPLEETFVGLRNGLLLSIVVIFLLLAANFQSIRLAVTVVSTVPAVLCGVVLMLLVTGTTLNVQSFMGAIMAIGIAVANAILLVTFAEFSRHDGASIIDAAVGGGAGRLRAILMTATAMIAGMTPIAIAFGEAAEQSAPLGRAVIGGLALATVATLLVLPAVYAVLQTPAAGRSPSLNPFDPASRHYVTPAASPRDDATLREWDRQLTHTPTSTDGDSSND